MTWVKLDSLSGDNRVITKRDANGSADGSLILNFEPDGSAALFMNTGSFQSVVSNTQVKTNQYAHLAARYNFSTGGATVFFNGQPEGSTTIGQVVPLPSQPWRIGEDNASTGSRFLNGTLDDTRIYTAALSDSQINQIYLNTKP